MKRLAGIILALGFLACGTTETSAPATAAAPVVAAATAAPTPVATAPAEVPPATADELPVPEDFEPEATTGVTEANYRAELDRIAGEISAAQ